MKAGAAGEEAFGFGVVLAVDEAHELVAHVAMKPRRAEGVFGDEPAWREDGEVYVGGAFDGRGRGEDGVDGGVGVVEADGVDGVEAGHVVLVGRVVAVPGHDVDGGVVDAGGPELAEELGDDFEVAFAVFKGGDGVEEVAGVGEAVGADGAEVGEAEGLAVVFADVAAGGLVEEIDVELDAARDDDELAGGNFEDAALGVEAEGALLGEDEHLAVGVVEEAVAHGGGGGVEMDAQAVLE